jgi:undecaprenyl diphosphate synthase
MDDFTNPPRHIAIIMDGNGRWARSRDLPRIEGHKAGIDAVRATVETCVELGIGYLTLFAFSTENWKRPREEVDALMGLLDLYLDREMEMMMKHRISFHTIGRTHELAPGIRAKLAATSRATAANTGLYLTLALNYSGRYEIIDAARKMLETSPESVDEARFTNFLYNPDLPDPDLLIRTSGEMRISNFFLWQLAYCEIYVTSVHWPDFRKEHLLEALQDFKRRERRFGGLA